MSFAVDDSPASFTSLLDMQVMFFMDNIDENGLDYSIGAESVRDNKRNRSSRLF